MSEFTHPAGGRHESRGAPDWLTEILAAGYRPYVATAEHMLPYLNLEPFGHAVECFLLDDSNQQAFHKAYLTANSLSFELPGLKMPDWVLIDCAYMQTAVVGFVRATKDLPDKFLKLFIDDGIDISGLRYLPISGQIASPALGGKILVGISLFSLRRRIGDNGPKAIAVGTKALAMEVCKAKYYEWFYGISQYDNIALLNIHGRFGPRMEIHRPRVLLHPRKDMTLIYRMKIEFDPYAVAAKPSARRTPSFWMRADDEEQKRRMEEGIKAGKSFVIVPSFHERRNGALFLPIVEEEAKS